MGLMYANYTSCFKDVLENNDDLLEDLVMSTDNRTNSLKNMLIAKFAYYEIGGETTAEFKLYLNSVFNEWKDYYEEMLDTYETKINYLEGRKYVKKIGNTRAGTNTSKNSNEYSSTNKESGTDNTTDIDLPNQVTSTEYASGKSKNEYGSDSSASSTSSNTNNSEYKSSSDLSVEFTGGENITDLRKAYMEQIRNLYNEFAERFKNCFILLYN